MKNPYNFSPAPPPRLTERMLREELERRRQRRQLVLLEAAAVAWTLCVALLGLALYPYEPRLAVPCLLAAVTAVAGGAAVKVALYRKREELDHLCL